MKKLLLLLNASFVFFLVLGIYQLVTIQDGKLHITVCDVGQGDAVYLRTPSGRDILFDGGPSKLVLDCLARAMPFWDRSLDLVILSHPHADHLNGLTDVFEVYQVKQFATEALENNSDGFRALQDAVKAEGIDWQTLSASDRVRIPDGVSLRVIGPTQDYVNQTAVGGTFISSSEFASLEVLVSYKEFDMLLTGDSQQEQLSEAITATKVPDIEVLQVPHHGSKTGLTSEILTRLKPNIATISVGKNNYGHPNPHIVSLLEQAKIVIYRTDKRGDLRLISDGKTYNIE